MSGQYAPEERRACAGCGEPIERDFLGEWATVDDHGWYFMCSAAGHQGPHVPTPLPPDPGSREVQP